MWLTTAPQTNLKELLVLRSRSTGRRFAAMTEDGQKTDRASAVSSSLCRCSRSRRRLDAPDSNERPARPGIIIYKQYELLLL